MVKSKKMSKGSLAVIILAVLLVLSMVLGLTGAWFTSKGKDKTGTGINTFGKVSISQADIADGTWANQYYQENGSVALPGTVYTMSDGTITNASNVDIYVMINITDVSVEFTKGGADAAVKTCTAVETGYVSKLKAPTVSNAPAGSYDTTNGIYHLTAENTSLTITGGSVTIDTGLSNDYQEGSVKVTYTVKVAAIQAANIEAAEAKNQLETLITQA